MKRLTFILTLLTPCVILGANDICVHLNGGDDVAYIGELNTLEIWISNDVELNALQFPLEICFPSPDLLWTWDMGYGSNSPFNRHGDAIDHLILFGSDMTFDYLSCETFAAGAAALGPTYNLPTGSSRLLYSLQFGVIAQDPQSNAIVVQPYAYFGSNNWFFMDETSTRFSPDFCGQPVPDMDNPSAPPVTFDAVFRSPSVCGDADCSGAVDIDDVVYLINYIFGGGPNPCDPNNDGSPDC